MSYIFISHVEEDQDVAAHIASGLEEVGFQVWYYERDSIPGPSYLEQILDAIQRAAAVVLIISPESLGSWQVDKEVIQVHESGKPFIPLLRGMSHAEFRTRRPDWAMAMGAATSTSIPPEGVEAIMPRIVKGLRWVRVPQADAPSDQASIPAGDGPPRPPAASLAQPGAVPVVVPTAPSTASLLQATNVASTKPQMSEPTRVPPVAAPRTHSPVIPMPVVQTATLPAQAEAPARTTDRKWEWMHSFWMLWLLTWFFNGIAFFWTGFRVREWRWVAYGFVYFIPLILVIIFSNQPHASDTVSFGFATVLSLLGWLFSIAHGFWMRPKYLARLRSRKPMDFGLVQG